MSYPQPSTITRRKALTQQVRNELDNYRHRGADQWGSGRPSLRRATYLLAQLWELEDPSGTQGATLREAAKDPHPGHAVACAIRHGGECSKLGGCLQDGR